jgi:hypothetical protein
MSTPEPASTPAPQPAAKQPIVVPRFTKKDIILVVVLAAVIIGFITLAIVNSTQRPKNTLVGVVKGKHSTGERETLLDVSRKGVEGKTVDTGYYLKVFVAEENRTYDVIVERELWEQKKEGDTLSFLRPPNEQKY